MSCIICAENFNGSSRKITKCEFCDFEACLSCCKTFLLGETNPKCMNVECDKEWSRRHITKVCGQTFVTKEYKKHREQILYDKERALLPATQQIVERVKLMEEVKKEMKEIDSERRRLANKKADLLQILERLEDAKDEPVERVLFTKSCPSDDCRGFLSTQWKCGLCQVWVCPDCHEIKGERNAEHTCNPDSVATANLLAADTKPCPQCHAGIHKIDGCDQMWCTLCHTAFSWRTGKRETVIHNPHYYAFLRQQSPTGEIPRNPEIPRNHECVADLNHYTIGRIRNLASLLPKYEGYDKDMNRIDEIIRNTLHITHGELRDRYKEIDYVKANEDLRVSFMRNHINEETFKTLLQRSEKSNQKRQEIREIFQMIQTTSTDVIRRFQSTIKDVNMVEILPSAIQEISAIAEYANDQFAEIAKTYKIPPISLTSNLNIEEKKKRA